MEIAPRHLQFKDHLFAPERALSNAAVVVGVVMGSSSDWETLRPATEILAEFGIPHEARVVSAHRMPDEMFAYAEAAAGRGLKAIIAGAGGAPTCRHARREDIRYRLGVRATKHLKARLAPLDVQMPKGIRSRRSRSSGGPPCRAFAGAMMPTER